MACGPKAVLFAKDAGHGALQRTQVAEWREALQPHAAATASPLPFASMVRWARETGRVDA